MFFFRRKHKPIIIPRQKHSLSRSVIDPDALRVLYRLSGLGYEAYLVGGSVRDLLLGRTPKDFDVGTDARPREIKRNFRNCFLVGKRFRLAHVLFGKKVIETATFRKAPDPNSVADEHGLYQSEDNNYGTPEEDARRRDFTVNGIFYDIRTFAIIDWVGGLKDLEAKVIRSIGDPNVRFQEDPVRMMRAVRFAAKLDFTIAEADIKAMRKHAASLVNASPSRLCEEILRLLVKGATERSLRLAYEYGLLEYLLPPVVRWMRAKPEHAEAVWAALRALDDFVKKTGCEPTPAMAFAALLWPMVNEAAAASRKGIADRYTRRLAAQAVFEPLLQTYKFPRTAWMTAVDILEVVPRFWSVPQLGVHRDVRLLMHNIWPETWMFARAIAEITPQYTWQLSAWESMHATILERLPEEERPGEGENKPHTKKRRPRRRRRNHGFRAKNAEKAEVL